METSNPLVYLFRKVWHYSADNRKMVIGFWLMFVVAESIDLIFQPLIWARVINVIQEQDITSESIRTLFTLLMLTLVVELFFWSLHGPARVLERTNAFKVRVNYRKYLLGGVMSLPMEWHVEHHSGDTIDKIEKGTSALFSFSEDSFEIIYAVVRLIGSYVILVYFSPPAAYIVLAMIFISAWITMRFDRVLIGQYQKLNRAENKISESVFDAVSNIATVIILRVEHFVFRAIMNKVESPFELFKQNSRLNGIKWFLTNVCCNVMTIIVMGVYFWQNIGTDQGVLLGSVYLLISYLNKISGLFFEFTRMWGDIVQRKAKVMNSEELADDFKSGQRIVQVLPEDWRQLCVKGLNFSYHTEDGADLHLENVSFCVNRGERVAFIGESGSGKTTLLKIMRDFYHPRGMILTVDGDLLWHGFEGISSTVALVPQKPEIFTKTILENITMGAEYDMDLVRHYTDLVCFTDVAESLPHKFDSSIKEKGVNLSEGQQQRLALARGLLACRDKSIILLDEPTSSIDTVTEMKIYQNIFREFVGKTIISSVHKLHLLPFFDRIYLFGDGQIVASGTLSELLSHCPEFQHMWQQYHEHHDKVAE